MGQQAVIPSFDPRRFGVASVAGRRPANEDAWSAAPATGNPAIAEFVVVADGVGGQERGELAAQTAVAAAVRAYQERRAAGEEPPVALRAAVEAANRKVYQLARDMGVERMGCTLVAATPAPGRLDVAHVGDARAYLLQGGRLFPLTRDHTWVQEQVDRGTISAEDAARHEFRHIVQRVLGNEAAVEVALGGPFALGPGDRLLLCSDGLHDLVSDARLSQLLAGGAPPDTARTLVEEALAAGSEDNVTALVVAVGDDKGIAAVAPPRRAVTERLARARPSTGQGRAAPAAASPRRRVPVWPALLALALVVGGLFILSEASTGRNENATAATPTPMGAMLTAPPQTGTSSPAATSTAASSSTGYPDSSEAATPVIVCLQEVDPVFLWTEAEVEATGGDLCNEPADVRVLDSKVEFIPRDSRKFSAYGGTCPELDFVLVRTTNPPAVGWILQSHLLDQCPEGQP